MAYYNLAGFILFALTTSITPGPNNILLLSHGKSFGFNNAWQLVTGIFLGFFILLLTSGYGLASIILHNHTAELIIRILGSIWLIYLAFVIRKLDNHIEAEAHPQRIGLWQSMLMQFINPKAWVMAITGIGTFLPTIGNIHLNIFIFSLSFCLIGLPCMIVWIFMGDMIKRLLNTPKTNLIIGNVLFLLLVVSVITLWI